MEIIFLVLIGLAIFVIGMHVYFDNKRCEADMQELIDSTFDSVLKMFKRI